MGIIHVGIHIHIICKNKWLQVKLHDNDYQRKCLQPIWLHDLLSHYFPPPPPLAAIQLPFTDPDEWLYGDDVEKAIHEARSYDSNSNHHCCCK